MRYIHSEERLPIPDNGEHLEKEEKNLSLSLCLVFSLPSWLQSGRVCVCGCGQVHGGRIALTIPECALAGGYWEKREGGKT